MVSRRRLLGAAACLALALGLGLAVAPAGAQADVGPSEEQIKAAYLFKFLGFVQWPPGAFSSHNAPVRIGVLGADALADELADIVRTRLVEGRPVITQRLRPDEAATELHAVFVGRGSQARLPALMASAVGKPLLTITDSGDTPAQGSAINFVTVDNKVRFDIVLGVAEQMQLKISARLLAVARRVLS
jgi:hypothetical protein